MLETHAAGVAARRITPEQIQQLDAMLQSVDESTSVEDLVAHDMEFHRRIAHTAGSAYLSSLLAGLSSSTVRARVWRGLTEARSVTRTLAEHRAILGALADHDSDAARAWTAVHVGGVEAWLRRSLA